MTLFDMYDVEDHGELLTKDLCAAMAKTFGLAVEDITKVHYSIESCTLQHWVTLVCLEAQESNLSRYRV